MNMNTLVSVVIVASLVGLAIWQYRIYRLNVELMTTLVDLHSPTRSTTTTHTTTTRTTNPANTSRTAAAAAAVLDPHANAEFEETRDATPSDAAEEMPPLEVLEEEVSEEVVVEAARDRGETILHFGIEPRRGKVIATNDTD
jgi:cytoskeletal protein RodZ